MKLKISEKLVYYGGLVLSLLAGAYVAVQTTNNYLLYPDGYTIIARIPSVYELVRPMSEQKAVVLGQQAISDSYLSPVITINTLPSVGIAVPVASLLLLFFMPVLVFTIYSLAVSFKQGKSRGIVEVLSLLFFIMYLLYGLQFANGYFLVEGSYQFYMLIALSGAIAWALFWDIFFSVIRKLLEQPATS